MGRPCLGKVPVESLLRFKREKPLKDPETPCKRAYEPRQPHKSRLRALVEKELDRVQDLWERFSSSLGPWMFRYREAAERFLGCGILAKGFAHFKCPDCGYSLKVAFSCKTRLCPSCSRKRMSIWSEWLASEVLLDLPHRHWVLTVPKEVRGHFIKNRWLLNKLSTTAANMLMRQMAVRCPEAGCVPGVVAVVQTSGDTLNFNPHVHIIATTHCLSPSGRLFKVPYIPYVKSSRIWKTAVLYLLKNTKCIDQAEADSLWRKYLNGFNLNGETQDWVYDLALSKRLAQYVLKPAMAESRVVFYDAQRSKVFYVGRGLKDRQTGKRRSMRMCMDSAEFLAKLLVQVPPKRQKLVNYYGFYSNKVRGMWAKRGFRLSTLARRIRRLKREKSWRSQLWRVYEADPLKCPTCGEELVPLDLVFPPFCSMLARGP
ncbi:MAG: transposase zinc-binding domain-containing protein [Elusimicrobiota bacterium]